MLRKRLLLSLLGAFLAGGFILGIAHLFKLRFDVGDIYPPYSSLRSDPLGTKAFYESLAAIPGLSASRSMEPLRKLGNGRNTTLFIPGLPVYELMYSSAEELREVEAFMTQGGRIVVTVLPEQARDWSTKRNERLKEQEAKGDDDTATDKKEKPKKETEGESLNLKIKSLNDRWNFKYDFEELYTDEEGVTEPVIVSQSESMEELPESLSWYSAIYFKDLDEDWKTVYNREGKPVLIEKPFGSGSLVLATDSYFISNEALRKDRQVELLTWLIGPNTRIIFNETHLGIQSQPGVAALARKYRLGGLAAGLLVLASLFVWKNAFSLVPPHDDDVREGSSAVVAGKDSATGFTNLLRRSIPPSEIIPVCFEEFKKSAAHVGQLRGALIGIEQLVAEEKARSARDRRPIETYQRISKILANKKHL